MFHKLKSLIILDSENQRDNLNTSSSQISSDPFGCSDDETNQPCIVIYIVEPFTCGTDSADLHRLACLSLLRCYSNILSSIPESIRTNINFQV